MAYLRYLLVFCWIFCVSSISDDSGGSEKNDCCRIDDGKIDCSKKRLIKVPNCSWEKVETVYLQENQIETISKETFERFKHLRVLDLSSNNLGCLSGANIAMEKLAEINLSNNKFTDVPIVLSKMPNLRKLYLRFNNISYLSDPGIMMWQMIDLGLSGNKFTEVPAVLSKMPNLRILDLSSNKLSYLPSSLSGMKLNALHLSHNNFAEVPAVLSKMDTLGTLILNNNHIEKISKEIFQTFKNLRLLHLSSNNLSYLPDPNTTAMKLTNLDLSHNKFTEVPTVLTKMRKLDTLNMNSNCIQNISDSWWQKKLKYLHLDNNKIKAFPKFGPNVMPKLRELYLSSNKIEEIPEGALKNVKKLDQLQINWNKLKSLPTQFCGESLAYLYVFKNELTALNLTHCEHLTILIADKNKIESLRDSVRGLMYLKDLTIAHNRIKSIEENDLKGLESLETLSLYNNRISSIHRSAFADLKNLQTLNLAHNKFPELPTLGLTGLKNIDVEGNSKLTKFPLPARLPRIETLKLHYPYHCCAFLNREKRTFFNSSLDYPLDDTGFSSWEWMSYTPSPWNETASGYGYLPGEHEDTVTPTKQQNTAKGPQIKCTPLPDPFFPCEDLMGDWVLRCGVWIVFVLALCGNATVIIVILASHTKMDVSRFLISNLAFADLFMGIYLGFLAVVDISTLGSFHSYGAEWQMSAGCRTAGFLAILSSELSVFTLTVITLERYIAIKNAIRVNRKLQLKTAIIVMIIGWVFALVTATLPLFGVNSYEKFSVCLPFEISDTKSIVFLVFLLCLNASAFIVILFCYILMYCSIRGSNAWNASDFRVAKRMALLVFTDFACWAPIVFFSLTATFGSTLVNLSQAKIFTIFVFPLNSCANPFLYAIFTAHFKKDLLAICKRVEEKYPFLKVTKQRMSFSRRSSYSGAISENPNLYLRLRRFSLPVFPRGFNNSVTTNGRGSDSSHSNKNNSEANASGNDCSENLLTERETTV